MAKKEKKEIVAEHLDIPFEEYVATHPLSEEIKKSLKKPLVIRIDWGLWRNVAMTWAITEVAKHRPVKVIASWPLVFWGNPYIDSIHGLDDRDLFRQVIKGHDYIELEPYTDPAFFNDATNWLDVAAKQLGLDKPYDPVLFLAEHEKIKNTAGVTNKPKLLYQPFGSSVVDPIGADKSYRSLYVKDAQYIADRLTEAGFELLQVIRPWQPELRWCTILDTPDLRYVVSLCARYLVVGCDSCLHHCSKAFGYPAVVVWAGTDKERYGYDSSINLREHPMVAHTPMRLPMNSFDFDISNQHTNEFSQAFLDKVVDETINLANKFYTVK